ncbi:hypothetical protein L249_5588 [Ophiocordyceps polyrhachis-furcata BCC 54312]|uniref:Amidohydrolase-related domain-containing protein n=1 Tax=Ophiocordyceps polyrhachis-furcata BCC 54312 TaxID=1330021 RepID=A0A367LG54_9HYPO|nr:hypothetical protein L249_5588 [Ophiocordyceps polyrhachis-furcata BCC 54312]
MRSHCTVLLLALSHFSQVLSLTITNVTVVDVNSGDLRPSQDIVVKDNKIESIDNTSKKNSKTDDDDVDGTGKFAIPGLSDMHVHAYFRNDPASFKVTDNITMPLFVANGVTTVRDLGSNLKAIKSARNLIKEHQLVGPRVFFTGPMLDGKDSPYEAAIKLETAEQARQAVKNLTDSGVDFIKVHLLLSRDVFDEVARACQDENVRFGGHVPDAIDAKYAVEKGMAFIEHMSRLDNADGNLTKTLVEKQIWQCPTLKLSPAGARMRLTKALFDAGTPMVAGTDSPAGRNLCPGVSLHDELEFMNKAGLSQLETLQTATKNAASFLGREDEMGTVEAGKLADMVLLEGNPLEDISNVRSISAVIADGQVFSGDELKAMLAGADRLVQCNKQGSVVARELLSAGPSCCSI